MIETIQTTPFNRLHIDAEAKMVTYAGYDMPIQYPMGIKQEHLHTREKAGLFDVSHMGQIKLTGPNVAEELERLMPVDVIDLPYMKQRYALLTNEQGGVLDDLMITNAGDHFFMVVNAACKHDDFDHIRARLSEACGLEMLEDKGLLALQGPKARDILSQLNPEAGRMTFMTAAHLTLDGIECFVTCSGYTGEDGYEISVDAQHAEALAEKLLAFEDVEWIGLGARDTLRLEAGLCLYGHELSPDISPIEAGLIWAISKARRADGERAGGFLGSEVILAQISQGPLKKRVGLKPLKKMPVREGVELFDTYDQNIGEITSGGFGATVNGPISMGRVDQAFATEGTLIVAHVRGKPVEMEVVKLPFVAPRFYRG